MSEGAADRIPLRDITLRAPRATDGPEDAAPLGATQPPDTEANGRPKRCEQNPTGRGQLIVSRTARTIRPPRDYDQADDQQPCACGHQRGAHDPFTAACWKCDCTTYRPDYPEEWRP